MGFLRTFARSVFLSTGPWWQGWARDVKARDRDETETLTSRDRDETETFGFTRRDETETRRL